MRCATLVGLLLVVLALAVERMPAAEPSRRKPAAKKGGTAAAKATPRPKTPAAGEKPVSAPRKSAAKLPTGANAASSVKATPAPKQSAASAATAKPRQAVTADATEAKSDAKPAEEEPDAPEGMALPADTLPVAAETPARKDGRAPNATLEPTELAEFSTQPPRIQAVIEGALALTKRELTYTYGSADPESGGMDCSGTIHHLLRANGVANVPRDSAGQYAWLRKAGTFRAVVSKSATSFEFDELLPGDLMFWSGTYKVEREIPVTHVMLYLGTEKKTKKRVMFGASDGRSYDGVQRWGVSVFDFKMPRAEAGGTEKTDFLGYARIPGLRSSPASSEIALADAPTSPPSEEKQPAPVVENQPKETPAKTSGAKSGAQKSSAKQSAPVKAAGAKAKRKS